MGCFMPQIKNPIKMIGQNRKRIEKELRKKNEESQKLFAEKARRDKIKSFLDLI